MHLHLKNYAFSANCESVRLHVLQDIPQSQAMLRSISQWLSRRVVIVDTALSQVMRLLVLIDKYLKSSTFCFVLVNADMTKTLQSVPHPKQSLSSNRIVSLIEEG